MTMFFKWYVNYKETWGYEMRLFKANKTHDEVFEEAQKAEEWF